jgi:dienelactone hydrolase
MIKWVLHAASLVAILSSFFCLNMAYATPSLKDYGALPEVSLVAMSPSSNLIAFNKRSATSNRLVIISLTTNKQVKAVELGDKMELSSIYFYSEDQLILVASQPSLMLGVDNKFDLSTAFLVSVKDNVIRQLLIPGDAPVYAGQTGLGRMLGISSDGNYAYMPVYTFSDGLAFGHTDKRLYSLLKVNLKEKTLPTIFSKGTETTIDFFLDAKEDVIAQESYSDALDLHKIRVRKDGDWVDIFKEKTEIRTKSFVGLTPDYKSLVMLETDATKGRRAYYTMLLADGAITGPIFGRDDADIEEVISTPQRVVLGVRYSGFIPSYQFFDPVLNQKVNDVLAAFPEHSVYLYNLSPDLKNFLVNVQGSTAPSDYYLFSEGKPAKFLTSSYPQIKPSDLNPIGKVTFTARDGLKIPTLLTIPKGSIAAIKNLPAIMMPHGGPEDHDSIDFNWWAQAFASNGYLVIQPQFRGSNGFGDKHTQAGYGEWGKKMQDDLTDAVDFAVKKGMIDPNRICIVGGSYGGYAALAGGAFTPDLYKCVVSLAGIGNLKHMLDSDKSKNGRNSEVVEYMKRQFTNSEDDAKRMAAASPELFAENFKAPVLLIHGNEDKRVPIKQSKDMKSALKSAKKDVAFIELDKEDHHLSHTETRLQALEEMVKFVNANIGK